VRPVVAALAVVVVVGCGDSSKGDPQTVDSSKVENGIEKQLSTSTTKVTDVKCPTDVESKAGAAFKCDVKWSNAATGKVKVTEKSVNQFVYEPVPGSVQIPGSSVEKSLAEDLAKQGAPNATVSCPQNIIVKVGTTVTCNVSGAAGAATGTVTFTFSSETGEVDASSVETA
jgi:hypothetical protein